MSRRWISAAVARQLVADGASLARAEQRICERADVGLLNAKAKHFYAGKDEWRDCAVPRELWWARGDLALEQDWELGDFATWLEQKTELRAFGVEFELSGILEMLPVERRAIAARSLSVESDAEWIGARAARDLIAKQEGLYSQAAEKRLVELGGLGFVAARAVQCSQRGRRSTSGVMESEWDIPTWFWKHCVQSAEARVDWTLGSFGGSHFIGGHWTRVDLTGVHFLRASLAPSSAAQSDEAGDGDGSESKPRLPDSRLEKWWDGKAKVREGLSIDELWTLARANFPEHHVARDRIRVLAAGRKRGPKPIGDESAAK